MRLRGVFVLAAGVPFWTYIVWFSKELRESPFGYEVGSVGIRFPLQFRVAVLLATVFSVVGVLFFLIDLIRWIKK
jgi:hypothetical protein